jgi:hypothetical protein
MRNINLPKTRVYVRCDAWGGSDRDFESAWLVSARALRNRPFAFQVWVDSVAACFDKVPPQCLYWFAPEKDTPPPLPLHKVQMWECLSGSIEFWQKAQLADVPAIVNLGRGNPPAKGHYWLTIDFLPEFEGIGRLDVGESNLLAEHKEANAIKLENGQIAWYPNNRLKYLPVSLTPEGAAAKIPDWKAASDEEWDEAWQDSDEILGGETAFFYGVNANCAGTAGKNDHE